MNTNRVRHLVAGSMGVALLALSLSVHATLFDLSGNTGPSPNKVFTEDGITLTVTGQYRDGPNWFDGNVAQAQAGLGLRFPGDNSGELDSIGLNEYLLFTISGLGAGQQLAIDSILFGNYEAGGDFSFYVDTSPTVVGGQAIGPGFDPGGNPWLLASDLTDAERTAGVSFGVKVNEVGGVEAFRIRGIVAHTIPEPMSLAMVGLGLLGLGLCRRSQPRSRATLA